MIKRKTKINLGAGNIIMPTDEWINHDLIKHRDEIEITFDLNLQNWYQKVIDWFVFLKELEFDLFDEIRAWDVLEHLNDPVNFMDNCWYLLKKDGVLDMKVCGWQNPNAHVDITHKRPGFDIRSFDYFVFDTPTEIEYNYYTDKKWRFLDGYPKYDRKKNILVKMSPIK